jgi:hypothetical protein
MSKEEFQAYVNVIRWVHSEYYPTQELELPTQKTPKERLCGKFDGKGPFPFEFEGRRCFACGIHTEQAICSHGHCGAKCMTCGAYVANEKCPNGHEGLLEVE